MRVPERQEGESENVASPVDARFDPVKSDGQSVAVEDSREP